MSILIRDVWQQLEASGTPPQGELRTRFIERLHSATGTVMASVDHNRRRHLLFRVEDDAVVAEDQHSEGVQVVRRNWQSGLQTHTYVGLVCLKPHLNRLFGYIVEDVLQELRQLPQAPDAAAARVLNRWRDLLNRPVLSALSLSIQVGLYGELWCLREMIRVHPSYTSAWSGPFGTRHDFTGLTGAVEVKSLLTPDGWIVDIHGHDQLEPPNANAQLRLLLLRCELQPTGESLQDLITSLLEVGADAAAIQDGLLSLGISAALLERYTETRFSVIDARMYLVDDDFPRVVSSSFVNGHLPDGVIRLNYRLSLENVTPISSGLGACREGIAGFVAEAGSE